MVEWEMRGRAFEIMQEDVLPIVTHQVATSNLFIPEKDATRIAEKETVASYKRTQEPNKQSLQRSSTSEQVLHEKANRCDVNQASSMAAIASENADISNKMTQNISERNAKLDANCTANTCEPNISVPSKKFPSRSARRKYAQRQLKKEMKKRAKENMQRTCGNTMITAEKDTVSSSNKILAIESQDIFEIRSNQVKKEENSSLQTQRAEMGLKRKHKDIEKSESSKNIRLEVNCTASTSTCEPNCSVPTKKLPSRSARRKYLKRQLKKEMKKRAAEEGTVGDTTKSEICHRVFSGLSPPTVCVDRLQEASSPSRIICRSDHPASLPLDNSSSSCHKLVNHSGIGGGQIVDKNLPSENNWSSISADGTIELLRDSTGNVAVRRIMTKSMLYYAPLVSTSDNFVPISTIQSGPIQLSHEISIILDEDNFLLWKSQVVPVLRSHGLICFIDKSKTPPNPTMAGTNGKNVPNPEFEAWDQQDQLILAWIFNSVSPQILAQVINCETSLELWTRIHQMHYSQSLAKVLELRLQLQTFKKGGATCIEYFQYMQSLADRLRSIGSDISEQDLIIYILQGLGTEYETLVTSVSMRLEPLTLAELQSLLLSHEARIQANLGSLSPTTVNSTNQSSCSNPQPLGQYNSSNKQANLNLNQSMAFTSGSITAACSSQLGAQICNTQATPNPLKDNQYRSNSNSSRENSSSRGCGHNSTPAADEPQCQFCLKWGHLTKNCHLKVPLESSSTGVNNDKGNALGPTSTRFRRNTHGYTGHRSNASREDNRWREWERHRQRPLQ